MTTIFNAEVAEIRRDSQRLVEVVPLRPSAFLRDLCVESDA